MIVDGVENDGVDNKILQLPHQAMLIKPHNIMLCMAPKSGTTAVYEWLYRMNFDGKTFSECVREMEAEGKKGNRRYKGKPIVHHIDEACWQRDGHKFDIIRNGEKRGRQIRFAEEYKKMLSSGNLHRIVIVRNPISRVVSAWKSKAACWVDKYGTDYFDALKIVPKLLKAANYTISEEKGQYNSCLEFEPFVSVLEAIRRRHGGSYLDTLDHHLQSQKAACGLDYAEYDQIIRMEDMSKSPPGFNELYKRLGVDPEKNPIAQAHASKPKNGIAPDDNQWSKYDDGLLKRLATVYSSDVNILSSVYNRSFYSKQTLKPFPPTYTHDKKKRNK